MSTTSKSGPGQGGLMFSTLGVVLVAAILIFVNAILKDSRAKIDATEFKIHTLSDGTKRILDSLDEQLKEFDDEENGERAHR